MEKTVEPMLMLKKGGEAYEDIVTSLGNHIWQDSNLHMAYLDFCKDKGFDAKTHLLKYAEFCLATSAANTSYEEGEDGKKTLYGDYTLANGMFAVRVNLLGLPQVKAAIVAAVSDDVAVRQYAYVEDGRLNCNVEIVGTRDEVKANNRIVRNTLRHFGFGDIETLEDHTIDEGEFCVSVPTLSSRTLP